MNLAHVNSDPGIAPGRKKGAAVHVEAMRRAFDALGARVGAVDAADDVAVTRALEELHAGRELELVYERYALGRYACSEFCARHGAPHVLEVNAPLAEEEERYRAGRATPVDASRERELFARATLVLAVSTAVARYAIERGARAERVLVRPNAVDAQLFRPRVAHDGVRERLVPAGRIALGFHGRLRPWHNFELLIDVFTELLARGHELQLVLLGEGEFEAAWRGRVDPARVSTQGWLPHAQAAQVVATFDVLPLSYSPQAPCYFSPLKLMEAMACGAVPVVPHLGDLSLDVEHGVSGLVYPAGDRAEFLAALESLLVEPRARERMGAGARAKACSRSWNDLAREVLDVRASRRSA